VAVFRRKLKSAEVALVKLATSGHDRTDAGAAERLIARP
jgi:hypothetical protein